MPSKMTINDLAMVAQVTIPEGWLEKPVSTGPDLPLTLEKSFKPQSVDNVVITFFQQKTLHLDDTSHKFYNSVTAQKNPAAGGQVTLNPSEIAALQIVLGISTVGNNQYTSSAPAFDIEQAATCSVAGKTVLSVRGSFKSGVRPAYAGIFVVDSSGLVEQIFLQAPSPDDLERWLPDWKAMLDSIIWAEAADFSH